MNTYTAKTLEEALKLASEKEGCTVEELNYTVTEEKKGLFSKKITIETYGISDVIIFAKDYLLNIIKNVFSESFLMFVIDGRLISTEYESKKSLLKPIPIEIPLTFCTSEEMY